MVKKNPKDEVRHTWEAAATGYAKWDATLSAGLDEITQTMLDMASVGEDMRVLDLACGTGSQTLASAERVGSNGRIVANDISETMLEVTRATRRRRRSENCRDTLLRSRRPDRHDAVLRRGHLPSGTDALP